MVKILVTGANGFVGSRLCRIAVLGGHIIRPVMRTKGGQFHPGLSDAVIIEDIDSCADWAPVLSDIDVIVHLAARVHVMKESLKDSLAEYRRVNVEGTKCLASAAAKAGVKRFVYVSTIKVNGECSLNKPFAETDAPMPNDPYSLSKWEAEELLRDLSAKTGMEVVIIRPPLVYGPGVKGNMLSLMRYIERGHPMPFKGINNKRSFISLDNFCDALIASATRAACAGHTFVVSDGEDLSTEELIRRISVAMNKKPRLIHFPKKVFDIMSAIFPSLRPISERLTASLVVDSSLFRRTSDWVPVQTVNDGIREMVNGYLSAVRTCH